MITEIPPFYIPTKYVGYYYNQKDAILYSSKHVRLRPLKMQYPSRFNRITMPGFYISNKGKRRFLPIAYLRSLTIFDTLNKFPPTRKRK